MLPFYNSFPHLSNQTQQPNASTAPPPQQVMPSNPSLVNSCNLVQNPMQFQPHFGMSNAQTQLLFSNSNTHLNPNVRPSITQPGFVNGPSHLLPLQNNHLGMTRLGSQPGQSHLGLGPQNSPPFVHNFPNLPQQLNQNMVLPNGQYGFPNMFQNMNQLVPLQMPTSSQVGPYGIPPYLLGGLNQPPQATVPQNPTFLPNLPFGLVHCNQVGQQGNQNQQNLAPPTTDANALKPSPVAAPQLQGNSSAPPHQSKDLQTSAFTRSQGNPLRMVGSMLQAPTGKIHQAKTSQGIQKRGTTRGSQKSQFHHMKNEKRKFGFPNEQKGKGFSNERTGKFGPANSTNQAREWKRPLSLNYTEQEIQQWREAHSERSDREAKLRKVQLKEILAKQAELGVEVAEVPSYYLSDSEKQGHGREENRRPLTRKERFQNKFNKRGRYDKKDRFAKKQRLADTDSSNVTSLNVRKPTLLQKLLSSDIGRDKSRLLQVFRFMVMNSFFNDLPDKPLKFPLVVVKESGCEDDVVEVKSSPMGKDAEGSEEENDEDDGGGNDNDVLVKEASYFVRREGGLGEGTERPEEEEGEIID
ncbi:hypothetical protein SLA2020_348490 [Shorea laevis]